MDLVDKNSDFQKLISNLKNYNFVTIDTEFLREKTYFPQFCLLQVATPNGAWAIDVLSPDINLNDFAEILSNPKIIKVFHSCLQDVDILYRATGVMPENIFDSQIAGAFCGLGEAASYNRLCRLLLNIGVDKTHRVTDWSKRPLDNEQIRYALNDVVYLVEIYHRLKNLLEEQGKTSWAKKHFNLLSDPAYYQVDENEIWKKLNLPQIPIKAKKYCKILSIWREFKAQEHDVPRRAFLGNHDMINIAVYLSGVGRNKPNSRILNEYKNEIIEFVDKFNEQNPEYDFTVKIMSPLQRKAYGMLKSLATSKAEEHKIARSLIAKNHELAKLIFTDELEKFSCMQGWRYDIFGRYAEKLLQKIS